MREETTDIVIRASANNVWEALTDFESVPKWNPFIKHISGDIEKGNRIEVRLQPPEGRGMTFRPTVLKAEPDRELRWIGRLLIPGIFDGEHYFRIEPQTDGGVRFVQGERFTGVLVPFFGGIIRSAVRGFEEMNSALKDRAECATQ